MSKSVVVVVALVISACTSLPTVTADWTTYPREEVTETSQRVSWIPISSLPPNVGTTEHKSKQVGDDAEVERYLVPRNQFDFDVDHLLDQAYESGKSYCRDDFRVIETHYFTGTEATLQFMRIRTPALRVRYRCSLALVIPNDRRTAIVLEQISRGLDDSAFFDISTKKYPIPAGTLFRIVRRVAIQEGIPITREGESEAGKFFIGGRDQNEIRWGRIEKLAALVSEVPNGAMLTFRLFAYQFTYHKHGVQNTERPAVIRGAQPWDRRTAYTRAMLFLSAVDAAIAAAP